MLFNDFAYLRVRASRACRLPASRCLDPAIKHHLDAHDVSLCITGWQLQDEYMRAAAIRLQPLMPSNDLRMRITVVLSHATAAA